MAEEMAGSEGKPGERGERSDARENRLRLVSAAKRLFAEQGVDATHMNEIARSAGVGQGTLYRHFAHKGEVCWALILEDIEEFKERVGAVVDDEAKGSPLERLEYMIAERVRILESHLPLFAAIVEATGRMRGDRPFRGPFDAWTYRKIVGLLEEASRRGDLSNLDIAFTADALLASTSPPLYRFQRNECGYSVERVIEGMRQLFIERLSETSKETPPAWSSGGSQSPELSSAGEAGEVRKRGEP